MSDEQQRFIPRPRVAPDDNLGARIDRLPHLKAELEQLLVDIERIVSRGEDAFLSSDDRTNYLAGSALIIHFDDIAQRRYPSQLKSQLPDVPWEQITATRNILAHDYTSADRRIVWLALATELPQLVRRILSV